ncbi:MAG: RagB/SusD family nutrient uptake outer membrane protein [Muribaculaceae bacterium]|nr:RagB/SusD family nutrient uptake outer membrane protein [Muribaculaceae bacterium]
MKKLLYIPMALIALAGFTSCEDAIDLQPESKIGLDEYFNTATDLQLFTNYFYPQVLTQNMDGNPAFDNMADDLFSLPLSTELRAGQSRSIPSSGGGWSWGILRRINTFLEYATLENAAAKGIEEADAKKYIGVARFFRAYFYAQKVMRFGDVPWIDRQLESDDPQLYAPRDSRELILTKILEDLEYAEENLPVKENESSAPYRLTKGAALALKSNICLYEGTFRKYHGIQLDGNDWKYYLNQCVDASEKLMSGKYGKYSIAKVAGKAEDNYREMFAAQDANKDEYILAVKYDQGLGIKHNANSYSINATQGQPGYARKFVCTYLMKDGSRFTDKPGWQTMQFAEEMQNRDPRLQQSVRGLNYHRQGATAILAADLGCTVTGYQPIKFVTESKIGNYSCDKNNETSSDLPEFRYAEVLLNLAEAKAELETLQQSDLDNTIGKIRERVGMGSLSMAAANANPDPYLMNSETGFTTLPSGSNLGVILEIRRERGVEMVQEGRRWNDLMRWKCGKMIDQSFTGAYIPGPGSYDFTGDGKDDYIFYASGTVPPAANNGETLLEIGKDIYLSDGNSGYINGTRDENRQGFNEERDYLYPIPSNELQLNPNLVQNPKW